MGFDELAKLAFWIVLALSLALPIIAIIELS